MAKVMHENPSLSRIDLSTHCSFYVSIYMRSNKSRENLVMPFLFGINKARVLPFKTEGLRIRGWFRLIQGRQSCFAESYGIEQTVV